MNPDWSFSCVDALNAHSIQFEAIWIQCALKPVYVWTQRYIWLDTFTGYTEPILNLARFKASFPLESQPTFLIAGGWTYFPGILI